MKSGAPPPEVARRFPRLRAVLAEQGEGIALAAIVAVATAERLLLAAGGGQYFFWDELRFERSYRLYQAIVGLDAAAFREAVSSPEHAGFTWLGATIVAAQHALSRLFTPYGDWSVPGNSFLTTVIAGALLSLASVAGIVLVHRLALAYGAERSEAVWAAGLLAASNTHLYFSRHLVPYDASLACALGALLLARTARGVRGWLGAGALLGASYSIYNGYYFLVPLIGLAAGWDAERRSVTLSRAAWVGCGALLAAGLPYAIGWSAAGNEYLARIVSYGATQPLDTTGAIAGGDFGEGWTLPWEYLWHSEGYAGPGLLAALLFAVVHAAARAERPPDRVLLWSVLFGSGYLLLATSSAVLRLFMVFGRTAKPLLPLIALCGAWALGRLSSARPVAFACAALLIGAGATSFLGHFRREFPEEIRLRLARQAIVPRYLTSYAGSWEWPSSQETNRPDLALVNAQPLYPVSGYRGFPPGDVLLSWPHPTSYPPLQYEGYTPAERAALRRQDFSIRLVRLAK